MASTGVVDLFVVYQFLRRLTTPFEKWEAYETGVIDDKGEIITPSKDRTRIQKESFKLFDLLVLRLKRLLEKIPGGRSRIASYAAALLLIKESENPRSEEEILSEDFTQDYLEALRDVRTLLHDRMVEDAPTMSMGGGNIAGGGIGGPDDVKVPSGTAKRHKKKNRRVAGFSQREDWQ